MKKGSFIFVLSTFEFTFLTFQIKLTITVSTNVFLPYTYTKHNSNFISNTIIYRDILILLKDNYIFKTASFFTN